MWIDFVPQSRLVHDRLEDGSEADWVKSIEADVERLWDCVLESFSECACQEEASEMFGDVPECPTQIPAPSTETTEPVPSKSLWEAEAEADARSPENPPDYIIVISNPPRALSE